MFHVSQLKKYHPNSSHIFENERVRLLDNLTFKIEPERIIDVQTKCLRRKYVNLVKVAWKGFPEEEATWESKKNMKELYPNLFAEVCRILWAKFF